MDRLEWISDSPEATKHIAATLAKYAPNLGCITLSGDLGAGKTCFSQGLIAALTDEANAPSPTFLLIKPYNRTNIGKSPPPPIYHMDFYRLEHEAELAELGLEEYLDGGLCLIEWPAIAAAYLPEARLDIVIELLDNHQRKITLSAKDDWQNLLNNVYSALC